MLATIAGGPESETNSNCMQLIKMVDTHLVGVVEAIIHKPGN